MYRPCSPSPSASAVARASSGVLYSFSLISPTTPSSSPPTTPISISITTCASAHFLSRSWAISRFSASGTAEPSHMCDWNSGSSPRSARGDLDDSVAASLGEPAERGVQGLAGCHVDRWIGETVLLRAVDHLRVNLWGRDGHDSGSLSIGTVSSIPACAPVTPRPPGRSGGQAAWPSWPRLTDGDGV